VARVARALVRANGLDGVVVVHEADLVTLAPVEPVDLVVGEWLGRFVVDDEMLDAVAAAGAWLKPDGRSCPSEVSLHLGLGSRPIAAVERWKLPLRGLDLAPALELALHTAYAGSHLASDLLGPAALAHELRPPGALTWPDPTRVLPVERDGVLHAIVGWWIARLAPEVVLTTAPGHTTHWGQYLWPVPSTPVRAGDRVHVHLALEPGTPPAWRWQVELRRGDAVLLDHRAHSRQALVEPGAASPAVPDPIARSNAATDAFTRGDLHAAVEGAAAATRGSTDAARIAVLQENLGIALLNVGRLHDAIDAFLAALHEGPRPVAQRFLVGCALRLGWHDDAARWRDAFEADFGAWTDPWGT
jgi:hypothetical protein